MRSRMPGTAVAKGSKARNGREYAGMTAAVTGKPGTLPGTPAPSCFSER